MKYMPYPTICPLSKVEEAIIASGVEKHSKPPQINISQHDVDQQGKTR
jgi:hypothetical protein